MIFTILLGLLGLDIIVLVHELGHLIIAKLMGIKVDAFSIGMGRKLVSFKYGETDYRISLLPIGGYCKMRGEEQFSRALKEKSKAIPFEEGGIFSVAAWKRILTYLAGPLFNMVFSVVVLSIIWAAGFTVNTYQNKIVLLSDYPEIFGEGENPADAAGLKTGDRIISLDGKAVGNYSDIQEIIYQSPDKEMSVGIERNAEQLVLKIRPDLDKETGAGKIGISPWVDPVINEIRENSTAFIGGLKAGETILSANGYPIENYLDIYKELKNKPEYLVLKVLSPDNRTREVSLVPVYQDTGGTDLGINFASIKVETGGKGPVESLVHGLTETADTFIITAKSIYLLFTGVNVKKAVSGPIRISYYVGEIATSSFSESIRTGFTTIFRFLSVISVALAFANILPIPIFDGGLILFTLIEIIRRKPLNPAVFYRYQSIGFVIIIVLFFLTTYSDISYLFAK